MVIKYLGAVWCVTRTAEEWHVDNETDRWQCWICFEAVSSRAEALEVVKFAVMLRS